MNGNGGHILRVDLTNGKLIKEPTPVDVVHDYIGGRGFGAYFLYSRKFPRVQIPLVLRIN